MPGSIGKFCAAIAKEWREALPKRSLEAIDHLLTEYAGIRLFPALAMIVALAVLGAIVGIVFPKFEATALLQFPEATGGKERAVDLETFKRVAASYASPVQLSAFVDAKGLQNSPAAARLIVQSKEPGYWEKAATPVLPFTKRDQRELGDLKDAAVAALLGLDLISDARTPLLAVEMIGILGDYYVNAVMRERIRAWVLAGQADSIGMAKNIEAAIVRAELDVALLERRAQDMKGILAKYPTAERMDTRQVISLNTSDESQRFLSPLAQLVGFESAISQRREQIRRWDRDLKQKQLLAGFYVDALALIDSSATVEKLLPALKELAAAKLSAADSSQEWVREASLRVSGQLDSFSVALTQFGLRNNSVRVNEVGIRKPSRLAVLAAAVGILGLACVAFLRTTLRVARA
ncbi:MAG: hypothetical protein BroJett031_20720 [Betaproteobacteria bacterium]|nr:MAG: hypothetical protein BroJett031_20720 [Betaproteobacteria bacterium]